MAEDFWVVGDVQGFLEPLLRVLRSVGLVDAAGGWSAGNTTLAVVGDLVDRGPDGVGVIEFLMRLQDEAARHGGRVTVLIGNHDILLLAARKFGAPFMATWLESGGLPRDLERLSDAHIAWLADLPGVVIERQVVLMHADAMFYLDYGSSVAEINGGFRQIMGDDGREAWAHVLQQFTEHRAFLDPDGEANLQKYLQTFGALQLIHGHTPVPRMLQVQPETVTEAYVYRDGRCVNVDPGMYLGGPGFAYQVTAPPRTGGKAP
jgi:hypothetical protein